MGRSDQWVNIILVVLIFIYLAVFIVGLAVNKILWLTTLLNLVCGLSVIIYWAWKQMRIQQHFFELREVLVLIFEAIIAGCAVYLLVSGNFSNKLRIIQYISFGIHFISLILFLIFMLTFKLKRMI